jgi:hypothetical protein
MVLRLWIARRLTGIGEGPCRSFAVIFGSDRKKLGTPEMSLREKQVCVTGEIRLYQGKPQIILRDPKQLSER